MALTVEDIVGTFRMKDEYSSVLRDAKGRFMKLEGDVSSSLKSVSASLKSFGQSTVNAGKSMTIGITAPILAIGGAALKMGMDAVESENLFEVSFGDMAKSARDWSTTMSDALGLNEFELRRTSATIFTMSESMGLSKTAAFDMATGVSELAHDMASFFNLKPDEAFEKLRAGITGEAEPLKRLGILVDENTVKMAAYKAGIAEHGAELTQAEKVQARWVAILDQTSKAQGDLARTLDSPTNQLRVLKERANEALITLGTAMLPVLKEVTGVLASMVPHIERAVKWFSELPESTRAWAIGLAGVAAAAGPLLIVVGKVVGSIGSLTTGLPLAAAAAGKFSLALTGMSLGPVALAIAGVTAAALILRSEFNKSMDQMKQRAQNAKDVATVEELWAQKTALTAEQQKQLFEATHRLNGTLPSTVQRMADASKNTQGWGLTLNIARGAVEQTTPPVAELSDEVRNLMDELSGKNARKKVDDIAKAVERLGGESKLSAHHQRELGEQLHDLSGQGIKLTGDLEKLRLKHIQADFSTKVFKTSSESLKNVLEVLSTRQAVTELTHFDNRMRVNMGTTRDAIAGLKDLSVEIKELPSPPPEPWIVWKDVVKGMIQDVSSTLSRSFADMLSGSVGFKEGLANIWKGIKDIVFNVIASITEKYISGFLMDLVFSTEKSGVGSALSKQFESSLPNIGAVFSKIGSWVSELAVAVGPAGLVMGGLLALGELAQSVFGSIRDKWKSLMNESIDKLNQMNKDVPGWKPIPRLAEGGIVTKPTLALIGEAGPEAVVPLSDFEKAGGSQAVMPLSHGKGGGDVHVSIDARGSFFPDRQSLKELARILMPHLPDGATLYVSR